MFNSPKALLIISRQDDHVEEFGTIHKIIPKLKCEQPPKFYKVTVGVTKKHKTGFLNLQFVGPLSSQYQVVFIVEKP